MTHILMRSSDCRECGSIQFVSTAGGEKKPHPCTKMIRKIRKIMCDLVAVCGSQWIQVFSF